MKYLLIAILLISNSLFLISCERVKEDIKTEGLKQESKIEEKKPVVNSDIPVSRTNGLPSFAGLIKKLKPAVVNISTTNMIKRRSTPFSSPFEDYFKKFFDDGPEREFKQNLNKRGLALDS